LPEHPNPFFSFRIDKKKKRWWFVSLFYAFFLRISTATIAMAIMIMTAATIMYMPRVSFDKPLLSGEGVGVAPVALTDMAVCP
jgi:hypothetical protein